MLGVCIVFKFLYRRLGIFVVICHMWVFSIFGRVVIKAVQGVSFVCVMSIVYGGVVGAG